MEKFSRYDVQLAIMFFIRCLAKAQLLLLNNTYDLIPLIRKMENLGFTAKFFHLICQNLLINYWGCTTRILAWVGKRIQNDDSTLQQQEKIYLANLLKLGLFFSFPNINFNFWSRILRSTRTDPITAKSLLCNIQPGFLDWTSFEQTFPVLAQLIYSKFTPTMRTTLFTHTRNSKVNTQQFLVLLKRLINMPFQSQDIAHYIAQIRSAQKAHGQFLIHIDADFCLPLSLA